jgi:hypothetical protein
MALALLGNPRVERLSEWWTPARFDMALRLVISTRMRTSGDATVERVALQMSSNTQAVRQYRSGERIPCRKSVYFIDQFLTAELGPLWMQAVDHELDESGNSQSRAPVRSAEGVY